MSVNLYGAPSDANYPAAVSLSSVLSTGWLIQATFGRAGGAGGLPTNRSGWAA